MSDPVARAMKEVEDTDREKADALVRVKIANGAVTASKSPEAKAIARQRLADAQADYERVREKNVQAIRTLRELRERADVRYAEIAERRLSIHNLGLQIRRARAVAKENRLKGRAIVAAEKDEESRRLGRLRTKLRDELDCLEGKRKTPAKEIPIAVAGPRNGKCPRCSNGIMAAVEGVECLTCGWTFYGKVDTSLTVAGRVWPPVAVFGG